MWIVRDAALTLLPRRLLLNIASNHVAVLNCLVATTSFVLTPALQDPLGTAISLPINATVEGDDAFGAVGFDLGLHRSGFPCLPYTGFVLAHVDGRAVLLWSHDGFQGSASTQTELPEHFPVEYGRCQVGSVSNPMAIFVLCDASMIFLKMVRLQQATSVLVKCFSSQMNHSVQKARCML